MVLRRVRGRPNRALSNQELLRRLQVSTAIQERNLVEAQRRGLLQGEIEELTVETASLRQRVVRKLMRVQERVERIVAAVQTTQVFSRTVAPILRALGQTSITGSGTFSAAELRDAEYRVFFHTEAGYMAEMRFDRASQPFYAAITREQANLLRQDEPPTELLARIFTRQEPVDH